MANAPPTMANTRKGHSWWIRPDGIRCRFFGPGRTKFTSGVKACGAAEEYRDAVVGSSTHIGRVEVDSAQAKLIFS